MTDLTYPADFNERNASPKDDRIDFDPETHEYSYVDTGEMLHSVTNLISSFFPPFDVKAWAQYKSQKTGTSVQEQLDQWEYNGLLARHLGAFMHEQIERSLLRRPVELSFDIALEDGSTRSLSIESEMRAFGRFCDEVRPVPYRTEWKIYEQEHNLAGTLDLLATDHNGDFVLFDWKRSRRLGKESGYDFVPNTYNPHSPGLNGLDHLFSTPYVIGCLQLNLYRHILMAGYGIDVKSMYLVALNPTYTRYHCLPVPVMEREVEHILFCIGGGGRQ